MTLYKQRTQKYFLFHFVKTFLNTFMLHTKMSLLFLIFKKKKKIKNKLCVANQTVVLQCTLKISCCSKHPHNCNTLFQDKTK